MPPAGRNSAVAWRGEPDDRQGMARRLTVLHHHFRPGGVREVIAAGGGALAGCLGVGDVVMLSGEAPPDDWREEVGRRWHPATVEWRIEPACGYWSEMRGREAREVREAAAAALRGSLDAGDVLWAHNLGLGRNLCLAAAVASVVAERGAEAVLHHHDWWWDGRWERWPEFAAQGVTDLAAAVAVVLPTAPGIRHVAVNAADARFVRERLGVPCGFTGLPLVEPVVTMEEAAAAAAWLADRTDGRPVWLSPSRSLRRKNPAEALLVMRWVDPEAVLVTTGGPSTAAEVPWHEAFTAAAAAHDWPVRCGVLAGAVGAPRVPALMASASAVVTASLREGFGLTWWEAAVLRRPLFARRLGMTAETLAAAGLGTVTGWDEVRVSEAAFDAAAERRRAADGEAAARLLLPPALRAVPGDVRESGGTVDFATLTAAGQHEVLAAAPGADGRLNPWLASCGRPWPLPDKPAAEPVASWAARIAAAACGLSGKPVVWGEAALVEAFSPKVAHWLRHPLLWP